MSDNPYPNASDTMHYELHTAWDEGYAEGFAAGRAAATPDPQAVIDWLRSDAGEACRNLLVDGAIDEFARERAAASPDPPDGDKRVRVTCFDPVTGESETQPLDPDNYIPDAR